MKKPTARKARVIVKARLGRKPPPPNETRRDRFKRIGERRMTEVLGKIALLGNLSSPAYDVTEADIVAMRETMHHAIEAAFARFTPRKLATGKPSFKFEGLPGSAMH
jgi:hypothetical protein